MCVIIARKLYFASSNLYGLFDRVYTFFAVDLLSANWTKIEEHAKAVAVCD